MSRLPASDAWPALFRIGVRPIDAGDWIDIDDRLADYLHEKQRLFAERPDEVFAAEAGTGAAQGEALALLVDHLLLTYPEIYRRDGAKVEMLRAGGHVALDARDASPLKTAALLVQEDLALLRRGPEGWRLVVGAICFPSSWRLADKVGRPIHEVHAPVPGFGPETRGAEIIGRMFDSMRPGTVALRWNWSLYGDDALFHPQESPPRRFGAEDRADPVYLRLERQGLTRLPVSGDILFTIRIHVDPLEVVARRPEGRRIAAALAEQLEALGTDQLAYKGLTLERERLLTRLKEIAD